MLQNLDVERNTVCHLRWSVTSLLDPGDREGATSNSKRRLALVVGEMTLVNTPFSLTMIWNTLGAIPPVYRRIFCADVMADEALVLGVVEGGTQVAGGEELALTNLSGLLHVQPLAVVLQQELVAARGILEGNAEHGTGAVNSHAGGGLITAVVRIALSPAKHQK